MRIAVAIAIVAAVLAAIYFRSTRIDQPESSVRLLLNEVRFVPAQDLPAFVEILNAGSASTTLDGVSLRNDKGDSFALPTGASIAAGAYVVVLFDGATITEEGTVHVPVGNLLGNDGALRLVTSAGTADGIAWGVNRPAAVELCRGGRCSDPAPGSAIARLPGVVSTLTTLAWAPLDPESATPGQANPQPPVATFAALPGTIYSGQPRFSWYSVRGAVRYRVEVATDEAFANRVHEADVDTTPLDVLQQLTATGPELAPGDYFWRVQAIDSAGEGAAFSRPIAFSVRARRTPQSAYTFGLIGNAYAAADAASTGGAADPNAVCHDVLAESAEAICKELPVPVIRHQKDTRMLTLEAPNEEPPMGWDTPDRAGYPYCARAGVVMVNAYYRAKLGTPGNLSQDRIGFEVYQGLLEFAPEYDLPVVGITNLNTDKYSLPLALGTRGTYHGSGTPFERDYRLCRVRNRALRCGETGPCPPCSPELEYPWGYRALNHIKAEIDADRPLIVTGPGHLYLIVGYVMNGGEIASIIKQDEGGREEVSLQHNGEEQAHWIDGRNVVTSLNGNEAVTLQIILDAYWTNLTPVKLGSDEASISVDSDNDGVVDFDEDERFATSPTEPDSDHDGVNDKQEMHYSVWDPDHGYHKTVTRLPATADDPAIISAANAAQRDPMELDKDSDDGGCNDGKENANGNGKRDSGETSNFVKEDDDCGPPPLGGRVQMAYAYSAVREATCVGHVTIDTRFTLEPEIVPEAPGIVITYRANEMKYDIRTDGCDDYPDDSNLYTFDQGFHLSGTMPLAEVGYAMFIPSQPKFSMQLPYELTEIGAANTLKGSYTTVTGGGPWPAETHVVFEPVSIESDPTHCGDPADPSHVRPELLEFCTNPTPCADQLNAPAECFSEPQRYAVIPFEKSFTWDAPNEPGRQYHIADVNVTVEICEGCGSR